MKIHIDFDDRLFDEPTWDALYLNAKSLRHIMPGIVDMVELYGRRTEVEGERRRCIVMRVDLLIGTQIVSQTIEFSLDGYWRTYDYGTRDLPAFTRYAPQARHAYERDLINRPELRMDILYEAMRSWLESITPEHGEFAPTLQSIVAKLQQSIDLSKRIQWG